jgi:hypothetical protein
LGRWTREVWIDLVWELRWDYRAIANGGVGFIRLYWRVNKTGPLTLLFSFDGITSFYDRLGPYDKRGCYEFDWKVAPVPYQRELWWAMYRRQVGAGSINDVDPANPP